MRTHRENLPEKPKITGNKTDQAKGLSPKHSFIMIDAGLLLTSLGWYVLSHLSF